MTSGSGKQSSSLPCEAASLDDLLNFARAELPQFKQFLNAPMPASEAAREAEFATLSRARERASDLAVRIRQAAPGLVGAVRQRGFLGGLKAVQSSGSIRGDLGEIVEQLDRRIYHLGLLLAVPAISTAVLNAEFSGRQDRRSAVVRDGVAWLALSIPPNDIPAVRQSIDARDRVRTRTVPEKEVRHAYAEKVAQSAISALGTAFRVVPGLNEAVVSLFGDRINLQTGHAEHVCWLSVRATRTQYDAVNHARVAARDDLKNYEFRFTQDSRSGAMMPVRELVPPVAGDEIRHGSGTDLFTMDPLAFEVLIRDLLIRMGLEAHTTKASHDGGIDVEAYDPRPVVGGRVIIQCKRYRNTIDASTVRDMAGVVNQERATKGVIISTSEFSPDARSFAQREGSRLELVGGRQLADLLVEHGFDGYVLGR